MTKETDRIENDTESLTPATDPLTSDLPLPPSKCPPADFGDYQFIERMGQGSFGEVFKVWSASKCRYEAMKLLHGVSATRSAQLDSFRGEVQRMAGVPGAHVAYVYHVGATPEGRPFFTMEFASGGRLDKYCDRKQKSIEDRISAVADICDTVGQMHDRGLIHCDIKPGNIVVAEESGAMIPKLVDFGIASHQAFQHSPHKSPRGTLLYMSPEQLDSHGGKPEKSWDIYALGVTLYELIVGECPIQYFPDPFLPPEVHADFVRRTPIPPLAEKLTSKSKEDFDEIAKERLLNPEALRHRLHDPWLQALVDKALCKNKEERYASAGELARNIRQYVAGRRPSIVPPTLPDRAGEFFRDHWLAVTCPAALVVIVALLLRGNVARSETRKALAESLFAQGLSEVEPSLAIENYQKALQLIPSRSDISLHLAGAYVNRGDAEKAVEVARSIPQSDPNYSNAQALIHGINQFRPSTNDTQASAVNPAGGTPAGTEYYYSLTLGPKEAKAAIALLDKAIESPGLTHDDLFRFRMMRAMRYLQLQDFELMEKETQWLVDTVPKSAVAWNLRGVKCLKTNQRTNALAAFDRAIQLNPEYAAAYQNRADLQYLLGRCTLALNDYQRAVQLNPAIEPFIEVIRINVLICLGGEGNLSKAKAACETPPASSQIVTPQTHIACGILWKTLGQHEREWEEFDRAVSKVEREGLIDADLAYVAILSRGAAATRIHRYADAIHDLNRAAEIGPQKWEKDPTNYTVRALVYFGMNDFDHVIADWRSAAERTRELPQRSLIYLWIWDLELSRGRTAEAAEALQQAKAAANGDVRFTRIVEHCGGGQIDNKVLLLSDAGSDPAKQVEAYYFNGLAAKTRGNFPEARHWFDKCRELDARDSAEYELAQMQLSLPWNNP